MNDATEAALLLPPAPPDEALLADAEDLVDADDADQGDDADLEAQIAQAKRELAEVKRRKAAQTTKLAMVGAGPLEARTKAHRAVADLELDIKDVDQELAAIEAKPEVVLEDVVLQQNLVRERRRLVADLQAAKATLDESQAAYDSALRAIDLDELEAARAPVEDEAAEFAQVHRKYLADLRSKLEKHRLLASDFTRKAVKVHGRGSVGSSPSRFASIPAEATDQELMALVTALADESRQVVTRWSTADEAAQATSAHQEALRLARAAGQHGMPLLPPGAVVSPFRGAY